KSRKKRSSLWAPKREFCSRCGAQGTTTPERLGWVGESIHHCDTWGALLCLVALEQYIDKNPWEGLRFGALSPRATGEFRGSTWGGHAYDVTIGPARTALTRDGSILFEADAGVVVRQYQAGPSALSFRLKSDKKARLKTSEFDSGEFSLKIDG